MNITITLEVGKPAYIAENTFDVPLIADALAAMKRLHSDLPSGAVKVFVRYLGSRYTLTQALRVEKIQNAPSFHRASNRAQLAA